MVKFKDFSRPLSVFFKYFSRQILFSRTFQDSPVYSSTFQACANPAIPMRTVKINTIFERKIVIILFSITFNINIEMVLLSTQNICFG